MVLNVSVKHSVRIRDGAATDCVEASQKDDASARQVLEVSTLLEIHANKVQSSEHDN